MQGRNLEDMVERQDAASPLADIIKRYQEEREIRVRTDSAGQYLRLKDPAADITDSHQAGNNSRNLVNEDVEVVIVGCGWGGIVAGVELRKAGVENIRMIDKASGFGGVWSWNRYPGVACDTDAYIYMPLLEEMGVMPTANYVSGDEILAHATRVAHRFDLDQNALFETGVTEARWDEDAGRWAVCTDRGDVLRARFLMMAPGSLESPKVPNVPGIGSFLGKSFHSSRWDFEYTGGCSDGHLTNLRDKRVAVVGTGASAVQCIPHLGKWAKNLYVFQRTPSAIDWRDERPTDEAWYKSQELGWQMRRIQNYTSLIGLEPVEVDLVNDWWTKRQFATLQHLKPDMSGQEIGDLLQAADIEAGEELRRRVSDIVHNPETAEGLKSWYQRYCKRPCFHDDYLQTFNLSNVTLVHTQGRGIERVTETGIVANDRHYPVDCIIYSTGFQLGAYADEPPVSLFGRDGISLSEKWRDGATTLHGFHIHGFPNFFLISIAQSAWGANLMHMLLEQGRHVAYIIAELMQRGVAVAEVSRTAEAAWVKHHEQLALNIAGVWENCTPSFFNNEGNMTLKALRSGPYGNGVGAFCHQLEQWRATGGLEGLELR